MLAVRIEVRGSGSRAAVAFVYEAQVTWPPCCRSFVGVVVCLDLSNASLLPVMKGQRVRKNMKQDSDKEPASRFSPSLPIRVRFVVIVNPLCKPGPVGHPRLNWALGF